MPTPSLRARFPVMERLPYYHMQRQRAVLLAASIATDRPPAVLRQSDGSDGRHRTEAQLRSSDGLLVGRPDYVNVDEGIVIDYKTGRGDAASRSQPSDSEARQLRLYAYLAREGGIAVTRGTIVRGDGSEDHLLIAPEEADDEASRAKAQLAAINRASESGLSFVAIASPSTEHCAGCPCNAFCEAFWTSVSLDWEEECGLSLEGCIEAVGVSPSVQGITLLTFTLEVRRGAFAGGRAVVEQVPADWIRCSDGSLPVTGDFVRFVQARRPVGSTQAIMRFDKVRTSFWSVQANGGGT